MNEKYHELVTQLATERDTFAKKETELLARLNRSRREAIEQCAKIAEAPIINCKSAGAHPRKCYECDCHGECPQDYISAQIRALLNEEKKKL